MHEIVKYFVEQENEYRHWSYRDYTPLNPSELEIQVITSIYDCLDENGYFVSCEGFLGVEINYNYINVLQKVGFAIQIDRFGRIEFEDVGGRHVMPIIVSSKGIANCTPYDVLINIINDKDF